MMHKLEAQNLPLTGRRLIEASAGTGKTYTIVNLYLRLLLNVGQAGNFGRALKVDEILVVTFTEAATQELKDRIRNRLRQAREVLLGQPSSDPFLTEMQQLLPDPALAIQRLLTAERDMDNASVFTIHGFCQRMLKQFAFESGSLFENTMEPHLEPLRLLACEDYWRANFYPLQQPAVSEISKIWSCPQQMLSSLNRYLSNPLLQIRGVDQLDGSLQQYLQQQLQRIAEVKQAWQQQREQLEKQIDGNVARYTGQNYAGWLADIDEWAANQSSGLTLPKNLERFAQSTLSDRTKKGKTTPELPLFIQIQQLVEEPADLKSQLIARAVPAIRSGFEQLKAQRHLLGFDDLLLRLDLALRGEQGSQLQQAIAAQFPVALIDEFQDTDPTQYQIFNQIYGARSDLGWLIIGDPKQAIYAFRGADIFTYMQAKTDTPDHYVLEKNYRSSQPLVESVNRLFSLHSAPFIYQQQIGFEPVAANDREETLNRQGKRLPAMQFCLAEGEALNREDYRSQMVASCVTEIQQLLEASDSGELKIGDKALKPSDMAILVRTGYEADLLKQALTQQGIASVYLSERSSVFTSAEASDLRFILAAMLTPDSERRLMAAQACQLFDLPLAELDRCRNDETLWQQLYEEFREYQQIWRRHGVLAALRNLVWQRQLATLLQQKADGERRLTNLFQLAELLQQASVELEGEHTLLRWFEQQCDNPDSNQEQQQLRLESERQLLQIVTIHKSKGLEYPLVFVPFLCEFRESNLPLYHKDGATVLELKAQEAAKQQADQERLAEDLRLLYVALTRAVYQLWLGVGPLRCNSKRSGDALGLQRTAIGYLLGMQEQDGQTALVDKLNQLASDADIVIQAPTNSMPEHRYQPAQPDAATAQARAFHGSLDRQWQLSSYTGLTRHSIGWDPLSMPKLDELGETSQVVAEQIEPWHRLQFPKGAAAGTFLHLLFESLDFTQPDSWHDVIEQLLSQSGFDNQWLACLEQWIADCLTTPLQEGLALNQIGPQDKLVEMEFYLPIGELSAEQLNRFLHTYRQQRQSELPDAPPLPDKPLAFERFHGMLKGFIDLLFCHQGRYYLLDYKSNHLGHELQNYLPEALQQAMFEHDYDLQYLLYSVALHRHLKHRLSNYQYETHFGGVFYLFLRGITPGDQRAPGIYKQRPELAVIEQLEHILEGADA